MAGEGLPVEVAGRALAVSCAGFYAWRFRPPSNRAVRHAWLTDVIREVHIASYSSYGAKRVHAELVLGRGLSGGGLAAVDSSYPKSVHVALPQSSYQIEVFDPSPSIAPRGRDVRGRRAGGLTQLRTISSQSSFRSQRDSASVGSTYSTAAGARRRPKASGPSG